MIISGNSANQMPAIITEFVNYWTMLNTGQAQPIVLRGGTTVADLSMMRVNLTTQINLVELRQIESDDKDAERVAARDVVREKIDMWRGAVAYTFRKTVYERDVPTLPVLKATDASFFDSADKVTNKWKTLDVVTGVIGYTSPLVLRDQTTIDEYMALVQAARDASNALGLLNDQLRALRNERDAMLPPIGDVLREFQLAVIDKFGRDSMQAKNLPRLSDPSPPKTNAYKIKIVWDASAKVWRVSWKALDSFDVTQTVVKISTGKRYTPSNERVFASVLPSVTVCVIPASEVMPGQQVWVRVFPVMGAVEGNGSNSVELKS